MNAAAAEAEESDYHESVHVSSDAHEGAADNASVGSAERIAGNNIVDDGVREQLGNNPRVNINGVIDQPQHYYSLAAVTWWLIAVFYNALPEPVRNQIKQAFPAQPIWVFAAEHIATAFNCAIKDIPKNVTPQQLFASGVRPLRFCGSKRFGDNSVYTVVGGSTATICTVTHRSGCVLHRPLLGNHFGKTGNDDAVFVLVRHNPQGQWGERFRTPEDISQVNECGSDLVPGAGGVTLLKAYLLKLEHANISLIYDITRGGEHLIDINTGWAQAKTFFGGCSTLAHELNHLHRRANGTKEFGGNPPRTAHLFKAKTLPFATKPSDYQVVGDAAQRKNTLLTTYNSETYVNARAANKSGNVNARYSGGYKACMVFDVEQNRDIAKFPSVRKAFTAEGRKATDLVGRLTHNDVQEATDVDPRGRNSYHVSKGGKNKKGQYVRIITDEEYKKNDPNIKDPLPERSRWS